MPLALLSSSSDEEEDRTAARSAQPPLRLARADLDRALLEKPPTSVVRRPGAALSLEELQVRARVIDRRAQELNRASKIVAAKELPPPSDAATEADETESLAAEPERWPEVDLGLSEHVANLKRLASTDAPGGTDASTVELALEDAVCSVSACDAQQREALHTSVESLKQHFQRRLEALEADFVRRAQDLSDALARAVTERKRASEAVVAAHAEECADRLATMTQHGEVLSRLPPTPAPGTEVDDHEDDALMSVSADVDAILGRNRPTASGPGPRARLDELIAAARRRPSAHLRFVTPMHKAAFLDD